MPSSKNPGNKAPIEAPSGSFSKKARVPRKDPDEQTLIAGVLSGNRVLLSQAITLIESHKPEDRRKAAKVLEGCLPTAGHSLRIGITGVPGVGKSSFIEHFGNLLIQNGHKVAVLAVDPSSRVSGGSILGDKTRMETLVRQADAYIRPSAAGASLGGVARKTRESIVLCEAAGFDRILVETVGVGQSETAVHSMTDMFLLLKLSGAGDELQGIKRGIMEMADLIVIHKADGDNIRQAAKAATEFTQALHLYPPKEGGWEPAVLQASSLTGLGMEDIIEKITAFENHQRTYGTFDHKRRQQNRDWLRQHLEALLSERFFETPGMEKALESELSAVEAGERSAFTSAQYLWERYLNSVK